MAKNTAKDDDEEYSLDDIDDWYTREEAAEQVGCAVKSIDRWCKNGTLPRKKGSDGIYRIKPSDLEKVANIAASRTDRLSDKADLLDVVGNIIRQDQAHIARLIDSLVKPLEVLTTAQSKLLELQSNRCVALENKVTEMTELHEELLNQQHMREVELLKLEASNTRKTEMMGMLKQQAPKILDAIVAKNGKAVAAVKLMQSLDPMMVVGITQGDILTAEQKALLDEILTPEQKASAANLADSLKSEPGPEGWTKG